MSTGESNTRMDKAGNNTVRQKADGKTIPVFIILSGGVESRHAISGVAPREMSEVLTAGKYEQTQDRRWILDRPTLDSRGSDRPAQFNFTGPFASLWLNSSML